MNVILISGKSGSGKDQTALIAREYLEEQGYRVLIAHYGDLVKYVCKTFFDWDGEKDEYGRGLLQYVGTDKIRNRYSEFWVDFVADIMTVFEDEWDYVLIPDTRFPNEITNIESNTWNCITLRVERPNYENKLTDEQRKHPSETALDNYKFDYTLVNDGDLVKLLYKVKEFVEVIG